MTEISLLVVRRTVSFARAVWEGSAIVEGVEARLAETVEHALELLKNRIIPVLVDPEALVIKQLRPTIVVDARIAKRNLGTTINDAPLVIGLGPGFTAGVDVDAVIETCRGHRLGRVIYSGGAIPDTGCPGSIDGHTWGRLLKAPVDGTMRPCRSIGEQVKEGDVVAYVDTEPVRAGISGLIRGMLKEGVRCPGYRW